jgi:hypothetical protein
MINPLDTPPYYCLKNIPDWKKREIELLFLKHIEWLKTYSIHSSAISRYENAINFMYSNVNRDPNLHESLKFFSRINKKLDSIRNEDFFTVFPEHKNIQDYMTKNNLNDEFDY